VETSSIQEVEIVPEKYSFLEEMKKEIKKISWPSGKEIFQMTRVVIGSTFFLVFSVFFVDIFLKGMLDSTARILKMLF